MSDSRPRYEDIAAFLRVEIAGGIPGTRLPSEAELCDRFEVSRMTARAALQVLDNEGLIVRRRGKGTFVAPRPVPRLLGSPLSFSESMRRRGTPTTSRILASGEIEPTEADRDALGLKSHERPMVLERLRLASDIPMAVERAVLHPSVAAILDEDLANGSLHGALEAIGRVPTRAQAWVSARIPDDRDRKLLELVDPAVLLVERRVIADQDLRPIEHTETRYAADRYTFEAVLHRDDAGILT